MDSLNVEALLGSVIRGALGGRRKRHRGALGYLAGGGSSWLNASVLMTAAGVAWGLWETAQQSATAAPASAAGGQSGAPRAVSTPPPIPRTDVVPPPLPPPLPLAATAAAAPAPVTSVPPEVLRVLRLTLSAARADGTFTDVEREAILAQARRAGAESLVLAELDAPQPLSDVVRGVADPRIREELYGLAFAIVRGDEQVQPGERTYLSELAGHLGLDAGTVARIEEHAAARIAASEGDQR